jgi:hypothetical protein
MHRLITAGALLLGGVGWVLPVRGEEPAPVRRFDWGFVASRQVDLHTDTVFRALGPLIERARSPDQQRGLVAVRPFYGRFENEATGQIYRDVLWPVAGGHQLGHDNNWRYLLAFWKNTDNTDPDSRYRLWVLPIYFQGRNEEGEGYAAVFPLGGRIDGILGLDRTFFVLFPVYANSTDGSVESQSWFWPIWARSDGNTFHSFRVFPFYGRAEKDGQFKKRFVLWPFWTSARYDYPKSSGGGFILFPLFGRLRLTDQQTVWVIPPLFRFSTGEKRNLTYCPWPFYQRASGPDYSKLYLWPLWGRKQQAEYRHHFVLWPIVSWDRERRNKAEVRRWSVMPVYQHFVTRPWVDAGMAPARPTGRYVKVWPLFSYERQDDQRRFRTLALWPARNPGPVERSWAPLWTLYDGKKAGPNADTEVLWGLYRRQRRGAEYRYHSLFPLYQAERRQEAGREGRAWSVLKGLVGYQREGTQKSVRLLYFIRLGRKPVPADAGTANAAGAPGVQVPEPAGPEPGREATHP